MVRLTIAALIMIILLLPRLDERYAYARMAFPPAKHHREHREKICSYALTLPMDKGDRGTQVLE